MKLIIAIPLSPSLNNAYATDRKTGRRFPSKELTAFKKQSIPAIRQAAATFEPPPKARYRLCLTHYFGNSRSCTVSDMSNRIKVAEDALFEALGFNDRAVDEVISKRGGVDPANPRTEIVLEVIA